MAGYDVWLLFLFGSVKAIEELKKGLLILLLPGNSDFLSIRKIGSPRIKSN